MKGREEKINEERSIERGRRTERKRGGQRRGENGRDDELRT